ncbi:MAG: zf-HC2 domain-containing protein [candidate division WOR-3 bacterium]|nr:zf-HC2 domain-containing protein [candidate division WOR-3 bacterium]
MNSCEHVDKVIDYRLHRLTGKQEKEFEAHLESCAVCRQEMAIELAIEGELAVELKPGFIEDRVMVHLRLRREQGLRSLWLYIYRVIVLGLTAAVVTFVLMPFLLKFPLKSFFEISQLASGLDGLLDGLPQVNPIFVAVGFGYVLLIASSIYTLARTRRWQ